MSTDTITDQIALTLVIENHYEDGVVTTTVETTVPFPPADEAELEDWENDHIFSETGTGKEDGDSAYFVTIASSSNQELIPVGTEYEFGL